MNQSNRNKYARTTNTKFRLIYPQKDRPEKENNQFKEALQDQVQEIK